MTTALPSAQQLLGKVGLAAPAAPSLPKSFDESTPRTTPPLSPSLGAQPLADEQLLLASTLLDSAAEDAPPVALNGYRLTLGDVVATARRNREVKIDDAPAIKARVDESVAFLKSKVSYTACSTLPAPNGGRRTLALTLTCLHLQLVTSVYGVTTGFGGVSSRALTARLEGPS